MRSGGVSKLLARIDVVRTVEYDNRYETHVDVDVAVAC